MIEPGPYFTVDIDSPFITGIARNCTPEEKAEAAKHGRTDDVPMSLLGVTKEGVAGVMGKELAQIFATSPSMLDLLEDMEANIPEPEINCSCHICAPCGCDENRMMAEYIQRMRELIEEAKATD